VVVRIDGARAINIKIAISRFSQLLLSTLTMAPTTRRTSRITPPLASTKRLEADTVKKSRFYTVYDKEISFKSLRAIARDEKTTESIVRRWLKQRENMGSLAYRTTRKISKKLRRYSKVTKVIY
jgi:hypothetical protein